MNKRYTYLVEAWSGLTCVGFRRTSYSTTAAARANGFIYDGGDNHEPVDRIYVRAEGSTVGLLASWQLTGGWVRCDDDALGTALGIGVES